MANQGQGQSARGESSNGVARSVGPGTEMQRDPDQTTRYNVRENARSVEGDGGNGRGGYERENVERGGQMEGRGDVRRDLTGTSPGEDMGGRGGESVGRSGEARTRRWRRRAQCVSDVMTRNPKTVRPSDPVQQIAQIMIDEDTGIVPVCEDRRLIGVVTDRDIVCRLVARGIDMKSAKASDVMTTEVECVTERENLGDVLRVMSENQVRRVPVVAHGDALVGIVSMADIAREADVDEDLQDAFEDISAERSFWTRLR